MDTLKAFYKEQQDIPPSASPPSSVETPPSAGRGRGLIAALAVQRQQAASTVSMDSVSQVTEAVQAVSLDTSVEEEPVHKRGTKGTLINTQF